MSVWKCKDRDGYKWEFRKDGQPYRGYTETKQAGIDAEADKRRELKDAKTAAAAPATPDMPAFLCPPITDWAGLFLTAEEKRITDKPNWTEAKKQRRIKNRKQLLTVVLRFWGSRPKDELPLRHTKTTRDIRPYHDLRLDDPIKFDKWLIAFDDHMEARGLDASTKNNQQTIMSMLYRHALKIKNRPRSGISLNPFQFLERGEERRKTRVLTIDEFMRIYRCAAEHLQFAIDIGIYAYALRIGTILRLTTDDMDPEMTRFTVWDHKTSKNGAPITVPIVPALRAIIRRNLKSRYRNPDCKRLIQAISTKPGVSGTMQGVEDVETSMRGAVERAGLVYGRAGDGITFHAFRHFMSTEAARKGIDKEKRKQMSGHTSDAASDWYTHFDAEMQRDDLENVTDTIAARRAKWEAEWTKSFQSPSKVLPNRRFGHSKTATGK